MPQRLGVAVVLGTLSAWSLTAAAAAVAAPFGALAMRRVLWRTAMVVLGATFVLGGQGLDAPKVAYLFVVAAYVVLALRRLSRNSRGLLLCSLGLAMAVAVVASVGLTAGHDTTAVLQDVATYGLLAAAGILAVDASRIDHRNLQRLLLIGGGLSTAGYALEWLDRRSLAAIDASGLLFQSGSLGTALTRGGLRGPLRRN
jgi:hypothetical protein